jgi:hypothetical protein
MLGFTAYLLNLLFNFGKPLYISPIGNTNRDIAVLEKILLDKEIAFTGINRDGKNFIVSMKNNAEAIVSSEKNINEQVDSLQRILRELTIEGKPFKSIDFRFAEPVISY